MASLGHFITNCVEDMEDIEWKLSLTGYMKSILINHRSVDISTTDRLVEEHCPSFNVQIPHGVKASEEYG